MNARSQFLFDFNHPDIYPEIWGLREPFVAAELADDEKPPLLRAYLKRWKAEIGVFFEGVGPDSPDAELLRIAPGYPVFRLRETQPTDT